MIVIGEIANKKYRGENEGRKHEFLVSLDAFFLDGIITQNKTNRRQRIEDCVDERELFSSHRRNVLSTF